MSHFLKTIVAVGAVATLPAVAPAVTVTVDGVGGGATTFAKLSEAVAYVNANSSIPNIINVVGPSTDDAQIIISAPVTINGDPNATGNPSDIGVGVAAIRDASDIGRTGRSYIEVETAGDVVINDLQIHPLDQGNLTTVDPISFYKPASGVGEYVLNRVKIGGSNGTTKVYQEATVGDPYYPSALLKWYAYLGSHGVYNILNTGGAGTYNITLNNCHGAAARSHVLNIMNKSGTTTVNGGVYAGAGEDCIRVDGGTGVKIVGTSTNRVIVSAANSSSSGQSVRILNSAVVDQLSYVDIVNLAARTNSTLAVPTGSGVVVLGATVTQMSNVRVGNVAGYPLFVNGTSTVNVSDSTFFANGVGGGTSGTSPQIDPVRIDDGTVTFKDTIFASKSLGKIDIRGGTVSFDHSAIPTDGKSGESLNTAAPIAGTVAANTSPVSASPSFSASTYTLTATDNPAFLRPTEAAYATAHSGGTFLYGGAGVDTTSVNDWNLY